MMKIILLLLCGACLWSSLAAAQSAVRILSFEKNDGIIDRGSEGGLHLGDVFEVNRYDGDFVYWVGRVEVVVVKSRFAGVKLLAKSESTSLQKGDVLEPQKREFDPMLDKLKHSPANGASNVLAKSSAPAATSAGGLGELLPAAGDAQPLLFGVTIGVLQPLFSSSRMMGSSFNMLVQYPNGTQRTINMSEAYAASFAFRAFFVLPLTEKMSLHLDYAYAPLNVNSAKETELLRNGLKGSASLAIITSTLNWRWRKNLYAGVGAGLYLPQATLRSSRQTMTLAGRQLGLALSAGHQLALGTNLWLRSQLSYNVFLDRGPAIHFLSVQVGPSFAIGRRFE